MTRETPSKTPSPSSSRQCSTILVGLTVSYLKGGPTHFQRKVKAKVELLLSRASPSPAPPAKKTAVFLRKRRTSGQVNAAWQNKNQYMADTEKRYNEAMKEATKMFEGDIYTKHSGSIKRMRLRISEVQPIWTKYFSPIEEEEEESEEEEE